MLAVVGKVVCGHPKSTLGEQHTAVLPLAFRGSGVIRETPGQGLLGRLMRSLRNTSAKKLRLASGAERRGVHSRIALSETECAAARPLQYSPAPTTWEIVTEHRPRPRENEAAQLRTVAWRELGDCCRWSAPGKAQSKQMLKHKAAWERFINSSTC